LLQVLEADQARRNTVFLQPLGEKLALLPCMCDIPFTIEMLRREKAREAIKHLQKIVIQVALTTQNSGK